VAKNDGYLQMEDVLRLSQFSQDQLYIVGEEFPTAGWLWNFFPLLRTIAVLDGKEREAAARPEGAGWRDFSGKTKNLLTQRYGPDAAHEVRVLFQWEPMPRPGKMRMAMYAPDWKFNSADDTLRPLEHQFRPRKKPGEPEPGLPVRIRGTEPQP
jgi:hypothetical protein